MRVSLVCFSRDGTAPAQSTEPAGRTMPPAARRSAPSGTVEPAQSLGGGVIVNLEVPSDRAQRAARGVHPRHGRGDPLIDGERARVAEHDLERDPGESANVYLSRPPLPPSTKGSTRSTRRADSKGREDSRNRNLT